MHLLSSLTAAQACPLSKLNVHIQQGELAPVVKCLFQY